MSDVRINRILVTGIAVFIIVQSFLIWNGGKYEVFNSPDASANYHFALRIYENKPFLMPLRVPDSDARQYLFTRSTRLLRDGLMPVGFLGLIILYGLISKIIFVNIIPYLTVLFSGVALYFFYRLIKDFFTAPIALASFILLAIHPAWWYFTNDALLPNVLFMSLTIIGLSLFISAEQESSQWRMIVAGVVFGFALWVRLSEALWLVPLVLYLWYMRSRRTKASRYALYCLVSCVTMLLFAWLVQRILIGDLAPFGYVIPSASSYVSFPLFSYLFPFGFHPRLIILHAAQYGLLLFWPYTVALGIAFWISGTTLFWRNQQARIFLIGMLGVSLLLFVLYGSWQVSDSPNPMDITIGTSYVRYFLPWYVFVTIPIIAAGYLKCMTYIASRTRFVVTGILVCIAILHMYFTALVGSPESIFSKKDALQGYDVIAGWIVENTEPDAIMLTAKGDKYLWPHRMVITMLSDQKALESAGYYRITEKRAVYYSGVTMDPAKYEAFNDRLRHAALQLSSPIYTYRDISVYPIHIMEESNAL